MVISEYICQIKKYINAYISQRKTSITNEMIEKLNNFNNFFFLSNDELDKKYGTGEVHFYGFYSPRDDSVNLNKGLIDELNYFVVSVHEVLHALSCNREDKMGFMIKKEDNTMFGKKFNEVATVYLSEKITGQEDNYTSYKGVDNFVLNCFLMFLKTTKMSEDEFFQLYFQKENWLTEEVCLRFNSLNPEALINLIELFEEPKENENGSERRKKRVLLLSESAQINDIDDKDSLDLLNKLRRAVDLPEIDFGER